MTAAYRLALAGALGLCSAQTHAAFCADTYGGGSLVAEEGTTVCFVYDPASVDPLFGTLSVSGDNIFATPTDFKALSENTDGAVIVSGTGTIQVITKPGWTLDGISVGEVGDYRMTSGASSVDVDGYLRVFDWLDPTPVFGTEETTNLAVSGDLSIKDGNNHNWSATGGFDLTTSAWDGRDNVGLTLQNTLSAVSNLAGESAMIQKKAVGSEITVSVDTSPVPLPAAAWLFLSGLLGFGTIGRRRG